MKADPLRLRLLALALFAVTPVLGAGQQMPWQDVVRSVSPAVVVVETDKAQGSGFLVRADGTLITNHHVVADASRVAVRISTGEVFRGAFVMGLDESRDLAVLRVDGFDLPVVSLGNSNELSVGMPVLLLGAPRGLDQSASDGIVAAIRTNDAGTRLIQTSAAASPGSSGGPLLNDRGQVIGVLSFTVTQSQNLNFAIPISYARGILDRLVGVATQPLSRLEPLLAGGPPLSATSASVSPSPARPRSREEALISSKTIYVLSNDGSLHAGVASQLMRWGRYAEVARREQADLVLQLELLWENNAGGGRASARLIDRNSSQVLWSGNRGGAFTDVEKAGRQIVEDLQKMYQSIQTQAPRRPQ